MSEVKENRIKLYVKFNGRENAALAILALKLARFKNYITASYATGRLCTVGDQCEYENCLFLHDKDKPDLIVVSHSYFGKKSNKEKFDFF
jgi:hypothetical protein